ncbi:MAG: agmatine deiminase family protein [Myxococcota bacterium]|nr:agmatine deiminase family protein [Myxococcota bacterium]
MEPPDDRAGYTKDEINRLGWYQPVYPDEEESRRAADRMAAMREGQDLHQEEWRIARKDGKRRDLLISTSVVAEHDGVVHVMALMGDFSQRKHVDGIARFVDVDTVAVARYVDQDAPDAALYEEAAATIEGFFPGRDVHMIDTRELWYSGGGVHCVTNDQPAL